MDAKEKKWLDISELKKGDVCLYYETNAWISRMIRKIDGSDYNHASIYLGNEEIEEAIISGISKRNIYCSMIKGGKIEVKRLNPEIADMTPVLKVAESYVGRPYAVSQLFLLVIVCTTRKIRKNKRKFNRFLDNLLNKVNARIEKIAGEGKQSFICSELVYRSFDEVDENPNPYKIEIKRDSDVLYEKGSIVDLLFQDENDRMVSLEQIENIMGELTPRKMMAANEDDENIDELFENDIELQGLFEDYDKSQAGEEMELAGYEAHIDAELKEKILNFYTYTSVHILGLENAVRELASVNVFDTFEKKINPNFVTPRDLSEALNLVTIGDLKKQQKS